ncbi:MAG: acetylglutamate kinase [Alphaproteobacteria bacterium]
MPDSRSLEDQLMTAATLSEALPFMRKYAGATIVIKYGGHAMGDMDLADKFARDIVLMKQVGINPVVVHGGGPQIKEMMDRLRIESEFIDGLRVTDAATMEIVEMVLAGRINKEIAASINRVGGNAVGLSGRDGDLMLARKLKRTKRDPDSNIERVLDLGFVGEPQAVNPHVLEVLAESDVIPVIAPIGYGAEGETFNINADTFAGAVAAATHARRLLLLTDVSGVLSKDGELLTRLTEADLRALIEDGTVAGGMIPKVETCLSALKQGVKAAVIMDGRVPHSLLLELFTSHGIGTLIGRS